MRTLKYSIKRTRKILKKIIRRYVTFLYKNRILVSKKRRQFYAFTFVLAFIAITSIMFFSRSTYASDTCSADRAKCYTSVQIHLGDDIKSISDKYITDEYSTMNSYISEVCSINHIPADVKLIPGNYIIVPYYIDKI